MKTAQKKRRQPTFRTVWAALMKNSANIEKLSQKIEEVDQKLSQRIEEDHQRVSHEIERVSWAVEWVSQNEGGWRWSLIEMIETLIAARLWEKFSGYDYNLQRAYRRVPLYDDKNQVRTDIDILLADTVWVMAVEVKRELSKDDVNHHLRRMKLIRLYPPGETKGKKLLGALACGAADPDAREYAYNAGFFVLELTGESVSLITPPEGFKPKEW